MLLLLVCLLVSTHVSALELSILKFAFIDSVAHV